MRGYCKTLIRLMAGEHELRSNGRHTSYICQNCGDYEVEDAPHFHFKCKMFDNPRKLLWIPIKKAAPSVLLREMEIVSPLSLSILLFSGFHCNMFMNGHPCIMNAICYYVHAMYIERL